MQDTIYRLSKSRINLEELIKKIDIYSLGIQIPLLFIQYSNNINLYMKIIRLFKIFTFYSKRCVNHSQVTELHQKKHLKD